MVMHARKLQRISDGYYDKNPSHQYQNSKYLVSKILAVIKSMAVLGEMVPRTQVLAEEVHREIDHTLAKVHIILKKVTEIRREILETINLGIVINILIIVGHQKIDEVEMNIEQTTIGLVRKKWLFIL